MPNYTQQESEQGPRRVSACCKREIPPSPLDAFLIDIMEVSLAKCPECGRVTPGEPSDA